MKKKNVTAIAMMTAALVVCSCAKENEPVQAESQNVEMVAQVIHYCVDGVPMTQRIFSDEELDHLYSYLLGLARNGQQIVIGNENQMPIYSKEMVTFDTPNEKEASNWADKRRKEGYVVSITYDKEEGIFRCIARR